MTPARVIKSRKAQVKSTADNNDCFERMAQAVQMDDNFFERMTMFFTRIAQAIRTDANFYRTDGPSCSNGCPICLNG